MRQPWPYFCCSYIYVNLIKASCYKPEHIIKTNPIITSKVLGKITLQSIDKAIDPSSNKSDSDLDINQIKGCFKDSDSDEVLALYNAINSCIDHLNSINQSFIENASNEYNVNFDVTTEVLTHLAATIKKYGNINTDVVEPISESTDESSLTENNEPTSTSQNLTTPTVVSRWRNLYAAFQKF